MERWINKVAVITGASSGIGAAIVKALVEKNVKVVGLARRVENMEKLKNDLKTKGNLFFPIKCDVSKEDDLLMSFQWIEHNLKSVDILINNAAVFDIGFCIDTPTKRINDIMEVNVIGPTICIKEAVRIMKKSDSPGHIFNINSILGQEIQLCDGRSFSMYGPSKFALKALSRVVELELEYLKHPIKVTTIYPGLVKSEMPPEDVLEAYTYLDAEDISNAVLYALSTPPHVQVGELRITPLEACKRNL